MAAWASHTCRPSPPNGLKVDRKGLFGRDLYVAADEIDRVEDGTVYLSVPQNALLAEV